MDYEIMMNGNVKIGQLAPEFEAMSSNGKISLNDYKGKWVVLFSHPGDFTPVCYIIGNLFIKSLKYKGKLTVQKSKKILKSC